MNIVQKDFCKPAWNCHIFMVCQRANLHKLETHDVDENLKTNKDFQLLGRMLKSVPHAHAANTYYHYRCYVKLKDFVRVVERRNSAIPNHRPLEYLFNSLLGLMAKKISDIQY